MNKLRRYSKEQALEIINNDEELKEELEELKPRNDECEIDDSFEFGNFFNLYDMRTDKVYKDKIVIQWLDSGFDDVEDDSAEEFDKHSHEVVTDSLEEAVVLLRDIEEADGDIG